MSAKVLARVPWDQLERDGRVWVQRDPFHLLVVLHHGRAYALEDACVHSGQSLLQGELDDDGCITCPGHAWVIEIDGGAVRLPSRTGERQPCFRVERERDEAVITDEPPQRTDARSAEDP